MLMNRIKGSAELSRIFAEGKMLGVLAVGYGEGHKEIGYLAAFSGNAGGMNTIDGFVPPIFDLLDPEGYFKTKEAEISALNEDIAHLESCPELASIRKELAEKAKDVNGIKIIAAVLPLDAQGAKDIAFQLRAQYTERLAVVLGCHADGKPSLTVCFSDDLVAEGQNAGKMVREAGKLIQGGGGGQAHFATAGGKNPDGLSSAVDKIVELIQG